MRGWPVLTMVAQPLDLVLELLTSYLEVCLAVPFEVRSGELHIVINQDSHFVAGIVES